mmetsp:Transcript_30214/g.55168  ORF Transcript_30214/g.55168 Transcript_30214/m.55168 type:complete len:110 (+) Transcript_30214:343-672(+)
MHLLIHAEYYWRYSICIINYSETSYYYTYHQEEEDCIKLLYAKSLYDLLLLLDQESCGISSYIEIQTVYNLLGFAAPQTQREEEEISFIEIKWQVMDGERNIIIIFTIT